MKLLSFLTLLCCTLSLSAQVSIVDFEDDGLNPPKPDCIATAEWINDPNVPLVTWEANPSPTGINTTPNCVKFVETLSSNQGNSLQFAFNGTTAKFGHNLASNKYVTLMVYSENQTNFNVYLELGNGNIVNVSSEKSVTTTLNTWTKVEFDFSGGDPNAYINPSGTGGVVGTDAWNSNIRIHFNNGTAGSGDIYYVDEYFIAPGTSEGELSIYSPDYMDYTVTGGLMKELDLEITNTGNYATFTLYADNIVIADNLDIPAAGTYTLNKLVKFPQTGTVQLKLEANGSDLTVENMTFSDYTGVTYPDFTDVTGSAGIVDANSLKYGGPTIADIDNDGHYDIVVNNHNDSPNKMFMNEGDGTFSKYSPDLSLWYQMDLHGSTTGDFDNDGDLDVVLSIGGGNGQNPSSSVFYRNDNGVLNRVDDQIGITVNARGRSPRFSDMDSDGDLDLIIINAAIANGGSGPQHTFYENNGDGTFTIKSVAGIEDAGAEKVLVTDFNNDQIDDFLMIAPLSLWQGNGDFTYTDVSSMLGGLNGNYGATGAVDVDIDNDGDLDLYISRGEYYFTIAENNTVDFFPIANKADLRLSGSTGILPFTVNAGNSITLSQIDLVYRSTYNGDFPIFLGSAKQSNIITDNTTTLEVTQANADGFPAVRTENGMYIGHVGNGLWQVEFVKNTDLYWSIHMTLDGITALNTTGWTPNNGNQQDILLLNNGSSFSNVSTQWNIPKGGNHWGVTKGDFNNDNKQDLYVYRMGFLKNRLSDYLLMNTGSNFEVTTAHGAQNMRSLDHGDMGQAFDYDSDGNVDILNGDDENGNWHLYKNSGNNHSNNYLIVDVGYAPISNVDAISAKVTVTTSAGTFVRRVGSAGETHSQSLLNLVHFGLGSSTTVSNVLVEWRDGETVTFTNESANQVLRTSALLPVDLLSFTGFATKEGNQLEWKTASEKNNDRFEIERSADSRDFLKIGSIKGNGTTDNLNQYTFLDKNSLIGANYYRLKQFDFDGQFTYSKVIRINTDTRAGQVSEFYPNPSEAGIVNLDYYSSETTGLKISVFDNLGQLIDRRIKSLNEGQNKLNFNFSSLAKGVYSIQIGERGWTVRQLIIH